jgi:hypothetical protein
LDWFVLNLMVFFIFGGLAPLVLPLCMDWHHVAGAVLLLAYAAFVLISLFALPVTGAAAVAAQPRCSLCGHRFWPTSNGAKPGDEDRFPVRFALAGGVITVASAFVGIVWILTAPGQETMGATILLVLRIGIVTLAIGVASLVQAVAWRTLRTRLTSAPRRALVLLLPAVLVSSGWLALAIHDHSALTREYGPSVRAPWVLQRAQLAPLPASAHDLAVHIFSHMFGSKLSLRFAAEPNDIERFIEDSPSLREARCRTYSKNRMRLARPGADGGIRQAGYDHDYFLPRIDAPRWYKEEIRGAGRRYEIKAWGGDWWGELIVDDERHVVYVSICR